MRTNTHSLYSVPFHRPTPKVWEYKHSQSIFRSVSQAHPKSVGVQTLTVHIPFRFTGPPQKCGSTNTNSPYSVLFYRPTPKVWEYKHSQSVFRSVLQAHPKSVGIQTLTVRIPFRFTSPLQSVNLCLSDSTDYSQFATLIIPEACSLHKNFIAYI